MSSAPKPTEAAPEAEAEGKPGRDGNRDNMPLWALLLAALPVLYVLSVGPAILVAEKTGLPQAPFRAFYAPLIWLHDHTFLEQPLEWYVQLWGVK